VKIGQINLINKIRSFLLSEIAAMIDCAVVAHRAFHVYAQRRDFAETAVLKQDRAKLIYSDGRAKAAARVHIS
jgi:hypothetical protein